MITPLTSQKKAQLHTILLEPGQYRDHPNTPALQHCHFAPFPREGTLLTNNVTNGHTAFVHDDAANSQAGNKGNLSQNRSQSTGKHHCP